jgi:GR25 family glycosyltransferase involved in LPS biosynthesis
MFDKLDIAVINLDRRPDRMAYIHQNIPFLYNPMPTPTPRPDHHHQASVLMNTGIFATNGGYRRFPAVDGQNLSKYYFEFDWLLDTIRDSSRILGEVGCSLSHYSLWRDHLQNPRAEYLLVFEDDVLFTDASHKRIGDVISELRSDSDCDSDCDRDSDRRALDILYVGGQWTPNYDIDGERTYFPFQRTTSESLDTYYLKDPAPAPAASPASTIHKRRNLSSAVIQGNRNVWFTPLFRTAGAYLISQRGAKRLLDAVEQDTALFMKTPLDMWLLEMDFRGYIDAFDRFPHPFYQAGFELVKEPSHAQNDIHRTDFQTVRIPTPAATPTRL